MIELGLLFLATGLLALAAFGAVFSIACYAIGFGLDFVRFLRDLVGFFRSPEFVLDFPEPDPDSGEREPAPAEVVSLEEFRARRVPRSPPPLDERVRA